MVSVTLYATVLSVSNNTFSSKEFRECFYLFARSGQIRSLDELTVIMRSLGLSPTIAELAGYLKSKVRYYSTVKCQD